MTRGEKAVATVLAVASLAIVVVAVLVIFVSEEYSKYIPIAAWVTGMSGVSLTLIQSEVKG